MFEAKTIFLAPYNAEVEIHNIIQDFISNKGEKVHLESDQWDHRKSLYDVLHYSKDGTSKPIYIHMKYRRHKSDDGFGGIELFIPHDENEDEGFTQIGINHSGFTYDGDAYGNSITQNSENPVYKVDIVTALRIMMQYALTLITSENLASFLTGAKDMDGDHINEDCVIVKIDRFYR